MTMPENKARRMPDIAKDFLRFAVHDDRIDFESDCYAVRTPKGTVLVDPFPLAGKDLEELEPVEAILLTASCHQRAAWLYRKHYAVKVYAPAGAKGCEEEPDVFYRHGSRLPGGLKAIHAPGPTDAHYAFLFSRMPGILITGDLVVHDPETGLAFVEGKYQDDPAQTRLTVRGLIGKKFKVLCFNHGPPLSGNAQSQLLRLLEKETREKAA